MKNEKIESKMEVEEEQIMSTKKVQWDVGRMQERVFNMEIKGRAEEKTEAQKAYENLFSHKEGFLPPKRNLYEALDSQEGYHRFG